MARLCWDDALSALVDRIAIDPRADGVTVTSGAIAPDQAGIESVQLWDVEDTTEWRVLGPGQLEETATVRGLVWVTHPGGSEADIRACRARARELLEVILDVLLTDPTLGGAVQAAYLASHTVDQGINADGRRAVRITFEITLSAWIR